MTGEWKWLALAVLAAIIIVVGAALLYVPIAHAQECGIASWYSYTGHRTASGERFDGSGMTAAHRSLPFNTMVRVTDQRTRRSIVVRISDRGPFVRGRIIDLSRAAATALGMDGLARVCLDVKGFS